MSYVDELLNRAFKSVVSKIWADARPGIKHRKRVRNRNSLYKNRIKLGRVKKVRKGGR